MAGSKKTPAAVLRELRTMCLALPDTTERLSWGHPNFRTGKKTFVTFEQVKGRPSIAFRLDAAEVKGVEFFETPYGRGKWVSVWVDEGFDKRLVRGLVKRSYQAATTPIPRGKRGGRPRES